MKYKWSLLLIGLFMATVSCDPCEDCQAITSEPTIELIFINGDSLSKIEVENDAVNQELAVVNGDIEVADSILNHLTNRIAALEERITNGENLASEKQLADDSLSNYTAIREVLLAQRAEKEAQIAANTEIASVINSGLVLVNQIELVEIGSILTFTDSATSYQLPLSFDQTFLQYSVTIGAEVNTLEVDYTLFQELDEERNALLRAQDITITSHSFDSLTACTANCLDGEATYTFYF